MSNSYKSTSKPHLARNAKPEPSQAKPSQDNPRNDHIVIGHSPRGPDPSKQGEETAGRGIDPPLELSNQVAVLELCNQVA